MALSSTDGGAISPEERGAAPSEARGRGPLRLDGRVALVTGATSGIGAEIARTLAVAGARVAVAGRDRRRGDEVVEGIAGGGGEATFVRHDLEDSAAPVRVVEETVAAFGGVDILVNNAGTFMGGPIAEVTPDVFDWAFRVNVRGAFFLTQAALPGMVERRWGRVIATSTGAAQIGMAGGALYGATKAALDQLMRAWAVEHAPLGITFNSVAPGYMDTPLSAGALADPETRRSIEAMIPANRLGVPRDVAAATLYLASEEAGYVQGVALRVDGGLVIA